MGEDSSSVSKLSTVAIAGPAADDDDDTPPVEEGVGTVIKPNRSTIVGDSKASGGKPVAEAADRACIHALLLLPPAVVPEEEEEEALARP